MIPHQQQHQQQQQQHPYMPFIPPLSHQKHHQQQHHHQRTSAAILPSPSNNNSGSGSFSVSSEQFTPASGCQTASSSTVFVHVDAGHIFQVQLGEKIREIIGPATVKIVSNDSSKPVPLQLTTPAPGQLVQQILDEKGILTHLIISSQHQHPHQHPHMTLAAPAGGDVHQQQQQHSISTASSPTVDPISSTSSSAVATSSTTTNASNVYNNTHNNNNPVAVVAAASSVSVASVASASLSSSLGVTPSTPQSNTNVMVILCFSFQCFQHIIFFLLSCHLLFFVVYMFLGDTMVIKVMNKITPQKNLVDRHSIC